VPIIKSAKKRMRQQLKRRERNKALKSFIKNLQKKTVLLLSTEKDNEKLKKTVNYYKSQVDKAWAKGLFKKNKSARLKSKIDKLFAHKAQLETK